MKYLLSRGYFMNLQMTKLLKELLKTVHLQWKLKIILQQYMR